MPDDERERLVKLARRADLPIIEDDVYGELSFDGSRPPPLRAFAGPNEDSHVVHVSSVSKTLAPAIASAGSPAAAGTIRSCASSTASRSRARRSPARGDRRGVSRGHARRVAARRLRGARFSNFIRVSAGTPWSERIATAIRTLGRLAARE
jgi:DNA-binding transcriptional MocR family regulator